MSFSSLSFSRGFTIFLAGCACAGRVLGCAVSLVVMVVVVMVAVAVVGFSRGQGRARRNRESCNGSEGEIQPRRRTKGGDPSGIDWPLRIPYFLFLWMSRRCIRVREEGTTEVVQSIAFAFYHGHYKRVHPKGRSGFIAGPLTR